MNTSWFLVCVCLLGTGKSSFFNKWCLLGRKGKVDVSSDFVNPFCFQRTLNFYWLASFFLFTIKHPGDVILQLSSLPPEVMPTKTSIFGPTDFLVLPFIYLVPKHQACFQYFHTQGGKLFLEVIFICSATKTRCGHLTLFLKRFLLLSDVHFPPCVLIEISSILYLLVML